MGDNLLHKWFPNTERPLIISAPMFTVANGALAAAVTKAGGLGMVPAGMDPSATSPHLAALDEQLTIARRILEHNNSPSDNKNPLPIGVGFLMLLATPEAYRANALPILLKHRPAFVWLFGSDPSSYGPLVALFRQAGAQWGLKVFVQVGTVAAAWQVVRCGADVVVAQGSDAGGHQFAAAASVVTLVPEIADMLRNEAEFRGREVAVVAAGGVVDGRGVAAALALGADAVAMGTRFMTCPEADSNPFVRKAILSTSDGGATTTRSSMNDAIMGYPTWSKLYAGRTILHSGLEDIENGVPIEKVHDSFKKAVAEGDETRMVTFAGTGVGLAHKSQPAGEIVHEVRAEALAIIAKLRGNSYS
ncbi:2-nitropropane dioxygenase protein [Apiospora phragmitis]|uniref:2-nitropropane dioxygenase protein n=1 Tax=Apiospora phragmitis TaxID=2905665 RepID=A0ABR1T6W8_9PEZI